MDVLITNRLLHVYSFPNGLYCSSDDFPEEKCAEQDLPKCKVCPSKCTSCKKDPTGQGRGCVSCTKGYILVSGKCLEENKEDNCEAYYAQGLLAPGTTTGTPIVLNNGLKSTKGACMVSKDNTVYEAFPCTELLGGKSCQVSNSAGAPNTCSDNGYMLAVFRWRLFQFSVPKTVPIRCKRGL